MLMMLIYWVSVLDGGNEVGLKVNAEKSKYMLICRQQTTRQNHYNYKRT
jgi:hypothetical protein